MAVARDVRVGLKLEDKFSPELTKAQQIVRAFGDRVGTAFRGAGRAVAFFTSPLRGALRLLTSFRGLLAGVGLYFSVRGAYSLIDGMTSFADRLQKMSLRLGTSTEFLSEMNFALQRSGGSLEDLEAGIRNAEKNLEQFAATGTGEARYALEVLSEDFATLLGRTRNMEEIIPALSEEFKRLSETERVFVASKLFGRSGVSLIPLLIDDMEGLRRRARELGVTLRTDLANDAAAFQDALTDIRSVISSTFRDFTLELAPSLTTALQGATNWIKDNRDEVKGFIGDIAVLLGDVATVASHVVEAFASIRWYAANLELRRLETGQKFGDLFGYGGYGSGGRPGMSAEESHNLALKEAADRVLGLLEEQETREERFRTIRERIAEIQLGIRSGIRPSGAPTGWDPRPTGWDPRRPADWGERERMVAGWRQGLAGGAETPAEAAEAVFPADALTEGVTRTMGAVDGLKAGLFELQRIGTDTFSQMRDAVVFLGDSIATNFSGELTKAITGTQTFGQAFSAMAKGIMQDVIQMTIRMAAFRIIGLGAGALGGLLSSSSPYASPSSMIGPDASGNLSAAGNANLLQLAKTPNLFGMAEGGIAYHPVLAGEAGKPEAYVPLPDGRRIPVSILGGGGGNVYIDTFIERVDATDAASFDRQFLGAAARNRNALGTVHGRAYQDAPAIRSMYQ